MGVIVRLDRILEALEHPDDWDCFLDRNTGEVITVTDNEAPYVDEDAEGEDGDIADLPEWQRDSILEVRRALRSADLIPLPSRLDVHEWNIMREFSDSRPEPARSELLAALHGRGAFRAFRRSLDMLDLRDEWFEHRDAALRKIARDWLNENGIRFVDS